MSNHPTIQQGSQGSAVKLAQTRLNDRGYSLARDGLFGGQTKNAVKAYQTDRHTDPIAPLAVDGIVGPHTWGRLDPPTIQNGANGDAVKLLQELLGDFGFTVAIDGAFGPLTEQAVKNFQTFWGSLAVDGIAGPLTWTALFS